MLPHARHLRNVAAHPVGLLWVRSLPLRTVAVVLPGGVSNGELSTGTVPPVSSGPLADVGGLCYHGNAGVSTTGREE